MISAEKIQQARQAGYSNAEIADFLTNQGLGDKINQARQAGYSDDEVVSFLEAAPQPQQQPFQPSRPITKAESALTGAAQAVSGNFGDEIIAGLSAPVAYGGSRLLKKFGVNTNGLSEMPLKDIYRMEQQKGQKDIEEVKKANPGNYLGGEIAGSLYGAGKFGATKPGKALTEYLAKGGIGTKIAKSIPVGAGAGAIYGAGAANPDNIAESAKYSAIGGGALAPLAPIVGSAVRKFTAKPSANADQVKELASQAYKEATDRGGVLNESFTDKFLQKARNLNPQTEAGKLVAGDNPVTQIADRLQSLQGRKLSLDEVQEIDELLGGYVDKLSDKGVMTNESRQVLKLQTDLRNLVENATDEDVLSKSAKLEANSNSLNSAINEWESLNKLKRKLEIDIQNNYNIAQGINKTANAISDPADKLRYYQTIGFEKANKPEISTALKELDSLKEVEADLIGSVRGNSKAAALIGSNYLPTKELNSLNELKDHLIGSVSNNSKSYASSNELSRQKLGFWRNRQRQAGSKFINAAGQDANSLSNVEKQIARETSRLKPANSEFMSQTVDEAKSLANIRKQIANQEEIIKKQASQITNEFLSDSVADAKNINNIRKQISDQEKIIKNLERENMIINKERLETGKEGFEALKQGRQLWSRAAKLRDIEKIISRAEMTDNPATALKTGFRTLYHNPDRMRGYSADEKKLIKQAAESGIITDILRTFGSRLNPIISVGSGGGLGATAATQAGSMASRGLATKLQLDKAQRLSRAVSEKVIPGAKPKAQKYPLAIPALSGLAGYRLGTTNN